MMGPKMGVPNPQASDQYRSAACWEPAAQQEVSGGRASEASSAARHRSPSFPIAPHHSRYRLNQPTPTPTPRVCGKTVFHEIGPWCQKGWGPLL